MRASPVCAGAAPSRHRQNTYIALCSRAATASPDPMPSCLPLCLAVSPPLRRTSLRRDDDDLLARAAPVPEKNPLTTIQAAVRGRQSREDERLRSRWLADVWPAA